MCFSDKEHYFSQLSFVMDTKKLNINTHLENLSTILNDHADHMVWHEYMDRSENLQH